ncbi:MAG TPA: PLDc N-terminal domain-containing protein [Thermoanaerobaculia bacterium]|jgi:peptidoglycan/LPS O-acetylase OafA/YrhL|nr:PLDc N-terminal domain-containing protein [Thermoanaerobaculia bacterium]
MFSLLLLLLIPLGFVFWIMMLIEAVTKEPEGQDRLIWVIIIVFTFIIGALLYFFVRRPARIATLGR